MNNIHGQRKKVKRRPMRLTSSRQDYHLKKNMASFRLLYSMGSENSSEELRCRKICGCMAKLNYKHILEFQVHLLNVWKVQVRFICGCSAMVNEHLWRQPQHNQIKNVF